MTVFCSGHPLIAHKLRLLRSVTTPPEVFRQLVQEMSLLLAYESTADLQTQPSSVQTPLQAAEGARIAESVLLVPVLRAGLGMVAAFLEMIPKATVWQIGLKRNEQTLLPVPYYVPSPPPRIPNPVALLLDPMLATGGSAVAACDLLQQWGIQRIKYIGLLAAPEGIAKLQQAHPQVAIHVAHIDSHLNERGYIVPGLGDAGDRTFATL